MKLRGYKEAMRINKEIARALENPFEELEAVGKEIERSVKRHTPVLTGELKSRTHTKRSGVKRKRVLVINDSPYAKATEFGKSTYAAQPFMRKGFASAQHGRVAEREFGRMLDKICKLNANRI